MSKELNSMLKTLGAMLVLMGLLTAYIVYSFAQTPLINEFSVLLGAQALISFGAGVAILFINRPGYELLRLFGALCFAIGGMGLVPFLFPN